MLDLEELLGKPVTAAPAPTADDLLASYILRVHSQPERDPFWVRPDTAGKPTPSALAPVAFRRATPFQQTPLATQPSGQRPRLTFRVTRARRPE